MSGLTSLAPLLDAATVAVVGASARFGSVGDVVFRQLVASRGRRAVFPINPRYSELGGGICHPTIADVGHPIDLAVLAVPDSALEEQLAAAVDAGAGAVAIFGPCLGIAADGSPLLERLATIADEAAIPVCGGNGMGFANAASGLTVCGFYQPIRAEPGPVTLLTHSGSFFSAALHARDRLRYNLVVSTGNEFTTTMDAYLEYALDIPSTKVVGLFLETIRRPAEFAAAVERAGRRDIPVVALKVGRTERGKASVATHTAAIAGDREAFDAFFDYHGVHRVDSPEELMDTLELFASGRRAAPGGLGSIHDSGGERTLLIDTADEVGVPLPHVTAPTAARLAEALDSGLAAENPVDAWGTGRDALEIFEECFIALADDPEIGALAYAVDLTTEEDESWEYVDVIEKTFAGTTKPAAVLTSVAAAVDEGQASRLRSAGIPVLGSRTGLSAMRHLFAQRDRRRSARDLPDHAEATLRWRARLGQTDPLDEIESFALLADFGITVAAPVRAASRHEVLAAANRLGYPVTMKTAAEIGHKTEVDGVALGLDSEQAVADAYVRLSRLGPDVILQRMVEPGIEIAAGVLRDRQFGPLVVVAAGGTAIELLSDRAAAMPPIDAADAIALIGRLRIGPLFAGIRGHPPADIGGAARAIAAIGSIATHLGDLIEGLDVNPIIVTATGAVAVDVLIVSHAVTDPDIVKVSTPEGASP